jgi:HK97 family phage prohead protease
MQMQLKQLPLNALSLKFSGDGYAFSGYASVFDGVDAYGDMIQRGAYSETIDLTKRERPIRMRWNHYGDVIGKWLKMVEDEKGLYVEGELTPGHSKAMDVYASMKHGAIDGLSIGYYPKEAEQLANGVNLLKKIELVEISVVEEPADLGAKIGQVKSAIEEAKTIREVEAALRDLGGIDRATSCLLVSRVKSLVQGELAAEAKAKAALEEAFNKFRV